MGNRKSNRYNSGKGDEGKMAAALDDRAEYEEFKATILPKLRKMMKENKTAEEIYNFAQSFVAAKAVSLAISSKDEKVVLASIKEILDRGVGKAADRVEITQKYEKLSQDELEALLKSQEEDLREDSLSH